MRNAQAGTGLRGGAQEPAPQDAPVHTLRVFMNLIQIPTLVLDSTGRPVEEKTRPHFTVSLDGGKPFPSQIGRPRDRT